METKHALGPWALRLNDNATPLTPHGKCGAGSEPGMISRIPTHSSPLVRFWRSDWVQEQLDEIKMLALIGSIAYVMFGLVGVIKQAVELLAN